MSQQGLSRKRDEEVGKESDEEEEETRRSGRSVINHDRLIRSICFTKQ